MTKGNIFANSVLRKDRIYQDLRTSFHEARFCNTSFKASSEFGYCHSWVINYDDESDKSKKETPVVVTKVESADLDIYYPPKNLEFNHDINDDGVLGIDFKYILVKKLL